MKQTMFVRTKGQLLAAIGCTINFCGVTEITLQRKDGNTFYRFDFPNSRYRIAHFNHLLRQTRGKIRKMNAICFK